ncbi:MAG: Asp23/Gls24 family envelope stress response protein [Candidatus Fermentithermobacillus carboniphilus]|uniref:Asp23/Gls24 family envelope stress response protein n=1 Tax=Candidatus Fermentithermobacillus carboniphilus TaxID=3085328 RepID=A0AAT9LB92_9FIRM|nr:MAG: Asp23/Gls24 family envelope stress response protein [Candidatus Fermentithermobacillus carboniphilus]
MAPLTGKEIKTDLGKLVLSEEAIATIAGAAATECYGIVGMAGKKMTDGISELLGRENLAKGVSVSIDGEDVYIDLFVIVGYGVRISEVARMVVDKVRYTVENITGLKVKKVTVNVESIRFQGNSGS